jgi:hypothetical protein
LQSFETLTDAGVYVLAAATAIRTTMHGRVRRILSLADYIVMDAGRAVGRLYEAPYASQRWYWSVTVIGASQSGIHTSAVHQPWQTPRLRFTRIIGDG